MKTFSQFCEGVSAKGLKHLAGHYGYKSTSGDTYRNAGGGEIQHVAGKLHHKHSRSGQRSFDSLNDLGKHLSDVHQTKMDVGYDAGDSPKHEAPKSAKRPKAVKEKPHQQSFAF